MAMPPEWLAESYVDGMSNIDGEGNLWVVALMRGTIKRTSHKLHYILLISNSMSFHHMEPQTFSHVCQATAMGTHWDGNVLLLIIIYLNFWC